MPPKQGFVDLIDFFERWPAERRKMLAAAESGTLGREDCETLRAMIFIVDCVGPNDMAPTANPCGVYRVVPTSGVA